MFENENIFSLLSGLEDKINKIDEEKEFLENENRDLNKACLTRAKEVNKLKDNIYKYLKCLEYGNKIDIKYQYCNLQHALNETPFYSESRALD